MPRSLCFAFLNARELVSVFVTGPFRLLTLWNSSSNNSSLVSGTASGVGDAEHGWKGAN